jgi:hypothetical protein
MSRERNAITSYPSAQNQGMQYLGDEELNRWLNTRHIARIHAYMARNSERVRVMDKQEEDARPKRRRRVVSVILGICIIILCFVLIPLLVTVIKRGKKTKR